MRASPGAAHGAYGGYRRRRRRSIPIDAGKLAHEGFEVLRFAEVLVHRGEADIGDLVQRGERLHHQFADRARLNLVLAQAFEAAHDAGDHALDAFGLDGALSHGVMDGALQLLAVERFAPARFLDHSELAQLYALEGGEAPAAAWTEAPAPDRGIVVGRPAVLHL